MDYTATLFNHLTHTATQVSQAASKRSGNWSLNRIQSRSMLDSLLSDQHQHRLDQSDDLTFNEPTECRSCLNLAAALHCLSLCASSLLRSFLAFFFIQTFLIERHHTQCHIVLCVNIIGNYNLSHSVRLLCREVRSRPRVFFCPALKIRTPASSLSPKSCTEQQVRGHRTVTKGLWVADMILDVRKTPVLQSKMN